MKKRPEQYLWKLAQQERMFSSLYRGVSTSCGLSDCQFWALYYMISTEEPITQQDLVNLMLFPKQTINSAVAGLVQKGYVILEMIPGTRNKKNLILTPSGKKLTGETVFRLRQAEIQAVRSMTHGKMETYLSLQDELLSLLGKEFETAGLADGQSDKEKKP